MNGVDYGDDGNMPHWINAIWVVDQDEEVVFMKDLDVIAGGYSNAYVEFEVPETVKTLKAFSFCNLHGLWSGPVVEVPGLDPPESTMPESGAHNPILSHSLVGLFTFLLITVGTI